MKERNLKIQKQYGIKRARYALSLLCACLYEYKAI